MIEADPEITIALRIPGQWSHPKELIESMPAGWRMTPETLVSPAGAEIGFGAMDADDEFAAIFRNSCRRPPTADELSVVDAYKVNVLLSGPGGSLEKARTMMHAAAAIVQAGGGGVFIDNSALAHGGALWLEMNDDAGPDALSFAFVSIIGNRLDVWTMGMHVLGLRDVVMKRADVESGDFDIVEVIRYLACGDKPVENDHIIADETGPRFRCFTEPSPPQFANSPMFNPFGRLKLVSLTEIAETN